MKRKIMAYAVVPAVLGFGMLGAGVASAHGMWGAMQNLTSDQLVERQQTIFKKQADMLGLSEAVVKDGWSKGMTMKEIALANGITVEQLKLKQQAASIAQVKENLQVLVTRGVITQAQADARFTAMQTKLVAHKEKGHRGGMRHMNQLDD